MGSGKRQNWRCSFSVRFDFNLFVSFLGNGVVGGKKPPPSKSLNKAYIAWS